MASMYFLNGPLAGQYREVAPHSIAFQFAVAKQVARVFSTAEFEYLPELPPAHEIYTYETFMLLPGLRRIMVCDAFAVTRNDVTKTAVELAEIPQVGLAGIFEALLLQVLQNKLDSVSNRL